MSVGFIGAHEVLKRSFCEIVFFESLNQKLKQMN